MHKCDSIERVLISAKEIDRRVAEMGKRISDDFAGKRPLVIGILKGAWVFTADLLRRIDVDADVDFLTASSYGGKTKSSGELKILKDLTVSCKNRDVLILEDIIDSGVTLSRVKSILEERKANSVRIATLLSKPSRRKVDVKVDYIGFEIPDEFVVGYGMDYDERFRGLDDVCVLKKEVYEND